MEKIFLSLPPNVVLENVNEVDQDKWDEWNEQSKMTFNYIIELCERNEKYIFASDLFKIEGIENKINLHKILAAGKYNIAYETANFISNQDL